MNIDILEYLSLLDNYVVLRRSDVFPEIRFGGDVDLLVEDRDNAEKIFVEHFLQADVDAYSIQVERRAGHTHIDVFMENVLFVRFDLIDSFAFLSRIHVKPGFTAHALTNKISEIIDGKVIFFPAQLDDLLIRYLEYIEYFETIPTKEKHLAYVLKHAETVSWSDFINHVHRFTKLIHDAYVENSNKKDACCIGVGFRKRLDSVIRCLSPTLREQLKKVYHFLRGCI
ncbi:hypothetical protein [Nitratidesulfovibrio termitidis]|uniref:hypothetical protein n=1 Tax=Nitratidesulfovibrio termitidis TaxID=42252 RepID=UPI0012EBB672|nr:hypothetical protein [Nitratidesulfovibrio termitidis]